MFGVTMQMKKENKNTNPAVRTVGRPLSRENHTGIPTQLKERMEQSTGLSLDDVRVHYNSDLPAKLDALAYTQGNQVEVGPGQEKHLPHELGHVIQQKLGAVRSNATHSSGVALNTDPALEHQADEIGAGKRVDIVQRMSKNVVQRFGGMGALAPMRRGLLRPGGIRRAITGGIAAGIGHAIAGGLGLTPPAGFGLTMPGGFGLTMPAGFGLTPPGGLGHAPAAGIGHAPAGGLGHAIAGGLGHAPAGGFGHAPAGGLGHAPAGGLGHAIAGGLGHAPAGGFGHAPAGGLGFTTPAGLGNVTVRLLGRTPTGELGFTTVKIKPHTTAGKKEATTVDEEQTATADEKQTAAVDEKQTAAVDEEQTAAAGEEQTAAADEEQTATDKKLLSNEEVRRWYKEHIDNIHNLIDRTLPTREQAKQAVELRNTYKRQARALMSDRALAEQLDKTDPPSTFEEVHAREYDPNLSEDDNNLAVIDAAQRIRYSASVSAGMTDPNEWFAVPPFE